jgi:hypothetical protein
MSEKKLRLNKETIRNLSDENLEHVAGGKWKTIDIDISKANSACVNVVSCKCETGILAGCH